MSIMELGALGEFLGSIGVIATLIYLAAQIRQNTRQLHATTSNQEFENVALAYEPVYRPHLGPVWVKGQSNPEALSDDDQQMFDFIMMRVMDAAQNLIHQKDRGAVDLEIFDSHMGFYTSHLATSGGARWWKTYRQLWTPRMQKEFDARLEQEPPRTQPGR